MLWQFSFNNLEKIDFINNQHQFVEMFLIRSLYLKKIMQTEKNKVFKDLDKGENITKNKFETKANIQNEALDQLKNVEQEEKIIKTPEIKNKSQNLKINSLNDLIIICEEMKELKIKYELENNLRLVSFKDQKIEISFTSNLDKNFIKELSAKLLEWTNKRWVIAFSKESFIPTLKEQKKNT